MSDTTNQTLKLIKNLYYCFCNRNSRIIFSKVSFCIYVTGLSRSVYSVFSIWSHSAITVSVNKNGIRTRGSHTHSSACFPFFDSESTSRTATVILGARRQSS